MAHSSPLAAFSQLRFFSLPDPLFLKFLSAQGFVDFGA